jgi:hypothetical protein
MSDFQRETFSAVAPSLHAVRDGTMPPCRRFWIERTKKAGKDSDLAICLLWLIAFPNRPFYAQVGAADKDQASIIRRRMTDLLHENPWLKKYVEIQTYKVVNRKDKSVVLDILAADVHGSHGATPDILVVNELSHVTKWEFVENLLDNADGVAQGLVLIATNAGFKGSKSEVLRKNALESDEWRTFLWSRPAPWIDASFLADAKKRNPTSRYNRLWWGKWVSGKGDALDEEDIDRCFCLPGPTEGPEKGWVYVAALDVGIKKDHSGLVAMGVNLEKRKLRIVDAKGWNPKDTDGKVDLMEVERTCLEWHEKWGFDWFGFDPHEAQLSSQRLELKGVPMNEVPFTGKNLTEMAEGFLQVVKDGMLECYEDEEGRLRRDFGKFNIVEKQYGHRLEAVADEYGHADVGTAVVICIPYAIELLGGVHSGWGTEAHDDNGEELTEEEIEDMPDEMRELYEYLGEEPDDGLHLGPPKYREDW